MADSKKKAAGNAIGPRPAIVIPKDEAPKEMYEKLEEYIAKARLEENRVIRKRPTAVVEILCKFFGIKPIN